MIDLSALRSLQLVATTGTLARAAGELGYTASAVSQQIKRLERQVGAPLLAPAGRGVILTPAGRALVEASGGVFAAVEAAQTSARSVAEGVPSGVLRVVAFSTAIRGLIAPLIPSLRAAHPGLSLRISELDPPQALAALDTGTADVALTHDADGVPTSAPASVRQHVVHVDIGDVAVHRSHPLAGIRAPISPGMLVDHAWVTSPHGTVCHQWFRRVFARIDHEPTVWHVADDFATQLALVAAEGVIALVPRLARPVLPDDVVVREVIAPPTREIRAAWRVSSSASPSVQALVGALRPAERALGLAKS
ncbi:LysR family transcriptional regulator [Janibacter limosus]|uniref:LysR family transcriptional regulator n=1 Tax=Janibacter limosus TaxID=53458 RepID=A0A4V0ZAX6_9MICO|nr:LysR family transcriptional regulator [Janibacter limosus]QBF46028.1 LysR family transcriptional regulator [Janibacter limosus]